ncbi:MAG: PAS domain S-box protein [Promethearchaeota archaeon]|nr:MAG: PAS domain S-box protein [Candidatus Lokiarchaeota archaeon]
MSNRFLTSLDEKKIKGLIQNSDGNLSSLLEFLNRKYNEKFRQFSKKFSQIFNSTPAGIIITELNGTIIDCNQKLSEITGYERQYFIGKNFLHLNIYYSGGWELLQKEYKEFLVKGHTYPSEFQIMKKSGDIIWISLAAEFIDYNGNQAIQAIIFDISYRKEREEKLKELSTITEKTTDAIIKTNLNYGITYMNSAAEKLFGWKLEEIKGKNPIMFNAEPEKKKIEKTLYNKISSGEIYQAVLLNKKKDGTHFYNECKVSPLINEGGEIYSYIASQRDITERIMSKNRLKESEKKYRRITELLPEAIFETDINGNITFSNSAAFQIFGFTSKELEESMNIFNLMVKNDRKKVKSRHNRLLEGELNNPTVILMVKKNNNKIYCRINSRPIYENYEVTGFLIIISNIHQSVIAKKKIKQSERELKRLNELKSQLLTRTSHELKTPLISIKGFSNLLLDLQSTNIDKKAIEYTKEIQKGCQRLERLINKILNAAKIESNNLKVERGKHNLAKLIKLAVKALEGAFRERNHSINLNIHEKMIIIADKEKILEIIENIISNAIKYTPPDGIITIRSEIKKDRFIISIEDTGIGFTTKEMDDIFVQFGKVERFGKGYNIDSEGTGLGLYISKRLIESHGGRLWVESEGRNRGSTFYFSIPKYDE